MVDGKQVMSARVVVFHPEAPALAQWIGALRTALPDTFVIGDEPEDADYAVVQSPPPGFFARAPGLRACFTMTAGVDALLRDPGLPADLPLYRLEDAGMGAQMLDYCRHAIDDIRLHGAHYRRGQPSARWDERAPLSAAQVPVGVVGYGALGRIVAQGLAAHGHPTRAFVRTARSSDRDGAVLISHGPDAWSEFLAASRVLVLLAPSTAGTRDLIDARALAKLPEGAWLINVARGDLVVDADLLAALDSGRLAGAVLDVFRTEPLPASDPFWRHPRVTITPHVSAPTLVDESVTQITTRLIALVQGRPASGLVDRGRGY